MNNLARQFADMYYGMRIETVPIPFGEKAPPVYGWMEKSHDELWANVGEKSNIGIIAGKNNVVILDPDNADSTKQLANYFQSLGIEHVGTRTRKGEHWWIRTSPPENYLYSSKKLHAPLVGDVRIRNGYALAEPSMVNDFKYELIGNPAKIPVVDWEVIFPLLNNCEESMDKRTEKDKTQADLDVIGLPIPLISKSYITPKLVGIQSSLFFTKKGESIQFEDQSWKSRSEAAYSLILSLVLRGVPAKEIASFVKLPDRNYQWVERSINNAIKAICDHQFRPKLAEYYHSPFPLTTSLPSTDYGTLLGILSLAWKLNRDYATFFL